MSLRNVTFEMSLKPFGLSRWQSVESVCVEVFRQWEPLWRHADGVSVLLWTADGSEILEYRGNPDDTFEWASLIGGANPRDAVANDPDRICLHSQSHPYMPDPPALSYRQLASIVATLRRIGQAATGKPVRVGATFDPGGEFAKSPFKYERHNEICLANTMGKGSFVCCYASLHADTTPYAGFPAGIPEGLPLGTFLGRQSQRFLVDLGFDYLWLSNGFGFGLETWKQTGPLFDGQRFDTNGAGAIREQILGFWRTFRAECTLPVEVRGTNLGTGADLATDAVPLGDIYRGGFGIETPPNSPWAAINGDFGIELVGYLSRVAETASPSGRFPFRFYLHDPWWLNSPWLDRYGREPHDIYLPLAVGRVDATGRVRTPDSVAVLTIDDSLGQMPKQCPEEAIPHLREGLRHAPDAPGPLAWIYPFDECHARVFDDIARMAEPFFNDWFVSGAVNDGLPLNTVVSTRNFLSSCASDAALYNESILLAPVPDAASALTSALIDHVARGGRVLLYGPVEHADVRLLRLLGVRCVTPLEGALHLTLHAQPDDLSVRTYPTALLHRSVVSAGGINTVAADDVAEGLCVLAEAAQGSERRVYATLRADPAWCGGAIAWVRGTNANGLAPNEHFAAGNLLRFALGRLGLEVAFGKRQPEQRNPVTVVCRNANAFWFSGYVPDTTVELRLRFPQGAPLLTDSETELRDGRACYRFGRAWRKECRVFVQQSGGAIRCVEHVSPLIGVRRRLLLSGLEQARVVFFPEPGRPPVFQPNPRSPYVTGPYLSPVWRPVVAVDSTRGYFECDATTGALLISWG